MAEYTDATAIAAYLGATLTPAQTASADAMAAAITVWIDHRTGRSWQVTGTVTDEVRAVVQQAVYLNGWPVVSVSEVATRLRASVDGWRTLDPSEYFLSAPLIGRLELPGVPSTYDASVSYESGAVGPPADLAHAATVLAADLLFPTLHPETAGAESISVGQNDITIRYTTGATGAGGGAGAGPSAAVRVVDSYRRVVLA